MGSDLEVLRLIDDHCSDNEYGRDPQSQQGHVDDQNQTAQMTSNQNLLLNFPSSSSEGEGDKAEDTY